MDNGILSILNSRNQRADGLCYKLSGSQYAMDYSTEEKLDIDENRMSVWIPFADGNRRDGVGDLLEVGGIQTERHQRNPIVLFDHGKQVTLPVALTEDRDTKEYTVKIDPVSKKARANAFFYQGKGISGVPSGQEYDHAVFCEQLFDMITKGYIRSGSIGYQVVAARELPPDYEKGTPKGLHLLSVNMLECSAVVMPANMDTVRKMLECTECCGKPLSPILVKSLTPYAPERKAQLGYEKRMESEEVETKSEPAWLYNARVERHRRERQVPPAQPTVPPGSERDLMEQQEREFRLNRDIDQPYYSEHPSVQGGPRTQESTRRKPPEHPKYTEKSQPSEDIDPRKAKQILHDGEVNGKPLTEDQRRMFGAAASRDEKAWREIATSESPGRPLPKETSPTTPAKIKPVRSPATSETETVGREQARQTHRQYAGLGRRQEAARRGQYSKPADIRQITEPLQRMRQRLTPAKKPSIQAPHSDNPAQQAQNLSNLEDYAAARAAEVKKRRRAMESRGMTYPTGSNKDLRAKYRRSAKGMLRRLKKSSPGSAIIFVSSKDLERARQDAENKKIKFHHAGTIARGLEKVKLMGDDAAIDDMAKSFGRLVRFVSGQKSLSVVRRATKGVFIPLEIDDRGDLVPKTPSGKEQQEYYYASAQDATPERMRDEVAKFRREEYEAAVGYKPDPPKKVKPTGPQFRGDEKSMDTENMMEESFDGQEPLGAQILRRLHDDHSLLMQEYDGMMGPLENEHVKKRLLKKLEDIESELTELEEMFSKVYPDLPGLIDHKDMTEDEAEELSEATDEIAEDLEDVSEEIEVQEEDMEPEGMEDSDPKDMDTMDDAAVPADSDRPEDVPPEEVLEGMERAEGEGEEEAVEDEEMIEEGVEEDDMVKEGKSLKSIRARYSRNGSKSLCPKCKEMGKKTCDCGKSLPRSGEKIVPVAAAAAPAAAGAAGGGAGAMLGRIATEAAVGAATDKLRSRLSDRDKGMIREGTEDLRVWGEDNSIFDENCRMKAFHNHKSFDGIAQFLGINEELNEGEVEGRIPPAKFDPGVGAIEGNKGVVSRFYPGSTIPIDEGSEERFHIGKLREEHRRDRTQQDKIQEQLSPGPRGGSPPKKQKPTTPKYTEGEKAAPDEIRAGKTPKRSTEQITWGESRTPPGQGDEDKEPQCHRDELLDVLPAASRLFKNLSQTRDFGMPHREMCKQMYAALEPISKEDDIVKDGEEMVEDEAMPEQEDLIEEQQEELVEGEEYPGIVMEEDEDNEEDKVEPGDIDEKNVSPSSPTVAKKPSSKEPSTTKEPPKTVNIRGRQKIRKEPSGPYVSAQDRYDVAQPVYSHKPQVDQLLDTHKREREHIRRTGKPSNVMKVREDILKEGYRARRAAQEADMPPIPVDPEYRISQKDLELTFEQQNKEIEDIMAKLAAINL